MGFDYDVEKLEDKAEILKVMAHPIRLCIIKGLIESGPCNVSTMQEYFEIPQPTVSSHLGKLKRAGVLNSSRDGTEIFYRVDSPLVKKIINSIF